MGVLGLICAGIGVEFGDRVAVDVTLRVAEAAVVGELGEIGDGVGGADVEVAGVDVGEPEIGGGWVRIHVPNLGAAADWAGGVIHATR
jgi:hypothetical protein